MEEEKKRKRAEDHGGGGESRRRSKKKEAVEEVEEDEVAVAAAAAEPQPSDEEVEEFYTILRRMRVAIEYFEKSGSYNGNITTTNINGVSGDGRKITELGEDGVDGGKIGSEKHVVVVENRKGVLDLNVAPEAEI